MKRIDVRLATWRTALCAASVGGLIGLAAAQSQFETAPAGLPSDLSSPDDIAWGTAEPEIIDTAWFQPQIQADTSWTGPIQVIRDHLPIHWRDSRIPEGAWNDLPLGGLFEEPRIHLGELFPAADQTPWAPPDPTLAVGPTHIVETVNMAIQFYSKTGTLEFSQNLDDTGNPGFFEGIGGRNFTFDPKCFYDHYAGRFVVVALEVYDPTESWIDIAVSDDSNPHGTWYKYRTNSVVVVGTGTYWVDYPGLGYDDQAYYVTGNLFGLNTGGFAGALFRTFNKTPLLSGLPAVYADRRDGNGASVQSAQHFGSNPAAFFVSVSNTSALRIHAIRTPITNPTLSITTVSVPPFSYPSADAPNTGGGLLDTIDGRINSAHWRNGRLYAAHGIAASGKNVARWYELLTGNWPTSGSVTLRQSGNINPSASVHTWFPAIYSDNQANVGVAMAASASNQPATILVCGRRSADPLGRMSRPKDVLAQAAVPRGGYSGRWGDYFDIAIDPANGRTFWFVGEYAKPANGWRTWIGSFTVPSVGDMNCDGSVNPFDIVPFVTAISNAAQYNASFPNCDILAGDTNHDGSVNSFDINGFVDLLGG